MNIRFFYLIFLGALVTSVSWSLDYTTYNELSQYILKAEQGLAAGKDIPAIQLEQKIEGLKSRGEDPGFYQGLEKIIKQDDGPIKRAELTDVLSLMRSKFHSKPMDALQRSKLADFFKSLVLGEKRINNIVVVGRTRGGKSTFLSTMIDPLDPTLHKSIAKSSIFSHTVTSSQHLVLFDSLDQGLYVARFIDTPGLSEVKPMGSDMKARSDDEVIQEITNNISGLNIDKVLLIFALSSAGLNKEDIDAFKKLKQALAQKHIFSGKIDLIFPRADQMNTRSLKNLVHELTSNFSQWGIAQDDYNKTYLSGSLINDDFYAGLLDTVLAKAVNILRYRNIILRDIFGVLFLEGLVIDPIHNTVDLSPAVAAKIKKIIPRRKKVDYDWLEKLLNH